MAHKWFSEYTKEDLIGLSNQEIRKLVSDEYEYMCGDSSAYPEELKNLREIIRRINENNFLPSRDLMSNKNGALRLITEDYSDDEIAQSFKRANEPFERKNPVGKPFKIWTPKFSAPAQMSKWFNTTSGFICGVFGGFFMVTLSAAITAAVGFVAVLGIAFVVMNINLMRCNGEYAKEFGRNPSEKIIQECRVKVGLGRSDGKDKGYWR